MTFKVAVLVGPVHGVQSKAKLQQALDDEARPCDQVPTSPVASSTKPERVEAEVLAAGAFDGLGLDLPTRFVGDAEN